MKTFALFLILASSGFAATYKGQNIDGKKYSASVKAGGVIHSISVSFEGKTAYLYFPKKEIVEVKLHSEVIDDLTAIEAFDGNRDWIINVHDLK